MEEVSECAPDTHTCGILCCQVNLWQGGRIERAKRLPKVTDGSLSSSLTRFDKKPPALGLRCTYFWEPYAAAWGLNRRQPRTRWTPWSASIGPWLVAVFCGARICGCASDSWGYFLVKFSSSSMAAVGRCTVVGTELSHLFL